MPRLRRALTILALTAATVILPLSDLSAASRSESHWGAPRRARAVSQSFWNFLVALWSDAGMRIDPNGES